MIIKNFLRSYIILFIFLILPFVQKQWFNLYLFNVNDITLYSILYYLSGIICPALIGLNSLNNYTYYKFYQNITYRKKRVKGKALLLLVTVNLIFLSYLIFDYIYINYDLISNLFFEGIKLQKPSIVDSSLIILIISILLIIKKTRLVIKKLILSNFILISFFIWYIQINNINVDQQFHIYRYFGLNYINLNNVLILVVIEIFYLLWSFLSYKTNLSDWNVNTPSKSDMIIFFNVLIFYVFIIIYYSILT